MRGYDPSLAIFQEFTCHWIYFLCEYGFEFGVTETQKLLVSRYPQLLPLPRDLLGGGALNAPTFFAALYFRNGAPQARQILGTCCELIAVYDSEVLKKSVQKFLRY